MSVERRGRNKDIPTVQRRGEKYVAPQRSEAKVETPRHEAVSAPQSVPRTAPDYQYDAKEIQKRIGSFENRIDQRVAELEADPAARKAFLKKIDGKITLLVIAFIFIGFVPPVTGLALTALMLYVLYFIFLPKVEKTRCVSKLGSAIEDFAVASKLKKSKTAKKFK